MTGNLATGKRPTCYHEWRKFDPNESLARATVFVCTICDSIGDRKGARIVARSIPSTRDAVTVLTMNKAVSKLSWQRYKAKIAPAPVDPWPAFLRRSCADCRWTSAPDSHRLPIEDAYAHFNETGHYTMLGVVEAPAPTCINDLPTEEMLTDWNIANDHAGDALEPVE